MLYHTGAGMHFNSKPGIFITQKSTTGKIGNGIQ